jgi:hypothetical protein
MTTGKLQRVSSRYRGDQRGGVARSSKVGDGDRRMNMVHESHTHSITKQVLHDMTPPNKNKLNST